MASRVREVMRNSLFAFTGLLLSGCATTDVGQRFDSKPGETAYELATVRIFWPLSYFGEQYDEKQVSYAAAQSMNADDMKILLEPGRHSGTLGWLPLMGYGGGINGFVMQQIAMRDIRQQQQGTTTNNWPVPMTLEAGEHYAIVYSITDREGHIVPEKLDRDLPVGKGFKDIEVKSWVVSEDDEKKQSSMIRADMDPRVAGQLLKVTHSLSVLDALEKQTDDSKLKKSIGEKRKQLNKLQADSR